MSDVASLLTQRFNSEAAGDLDVIVEVDWSEGRLLFHIRDGKLVLPSDGPNAELTIYLADEALTTSIFGGTANPIDAFMRGDFRSDGNLVTVFETLRAFS